MLRKSRTVYQRQLRCLPSLLAVLLAGVVAAQPQFTELPKRGLPPGRQPTAAVALGDIDGDGDLDMVAAGSGECLRPCGASQNRLYRNDGAGIFTDVTAEQLPQLRDQTFGLALGDVDGDGDLDLVTANTGFYGPHRNRLYLNDGEGTFSDVSAAQLPSDSDSTSSVALGDCDGDGDLDILFGNGSFYGRMLARLYLNDGTGRFTDVSATHLPVIRAHTLSVALADVDGDGDLDALCGNGGQDYLYLNDGSGTYTDATARLPADTTNTAAIAAVDVDGDGDGDLVLASHGQNRLYLNQGGSFIDVTSTHMPIDSDFSETMVSADLDGDGDHDLVVGNTGQNRAYLNDGTGNFRTTPAVRLPFDDNRSFVAAGDVDGDHDADVICSNYEQQNRLYLNDGSAVFADATAARLPTMREVTTSLALGDVDGDGDLDVVVGNDISYYRNRLHLNDGYGTFVDVSSTQLPLDSDDTNAVVLADFDGDSDLDLVVGNRGRSGAQDRLYLNDGSGSFTDATTGRMPIIANPTVAVAVVDVDGDGDLDLVLGGGDHLYLNDGSGTFQDVTATHFPVVPRGAIALAVGDVDRDGDPDLVLGGGGQNRLYLNDGSGRFADATAAALPVDGDGTLSLALGDVDGDGDLDLALGNHSTLSKQNRLYLNDGTGVYTDVTSSHMPTDRDETRALVLTDVDGDGDPDLVLGNVGTPYTRRPNGLYLNDGTGRFTDATSARMTNRADPTYAVAAGDVDADGDVDLLVGVGGNRNRLLFNLHRQLDTPWVLRIGRRYSCTAYARYGPPRSVDLVFPHLSTGGASIPLPPLGVLRLDPAHLVALPPFFVAPGEALGSIELTIPNLPGLIGQRAHLQALHVPFPLPARLTNATADGILE
ncbi:MAG: VCBS repeat-containing protein [Planctomycetota bacterium]